MYSRDEIKALTDKVLNMAKADAVEVSFDGGERAGTRWANSTITTNLVQYDHQISINVRVGQKQGSASTRELDDESLKAAVDEAQDAAAKARDNAELSPLDVAQLTETASNKAVKSQKPRAIEPGRYTTIIEPRPAARFLSTMMGAFNAGGGGGGFGGGGGGGGGFNFGGIGRPFVSADGTPKIGQKLF